MSSSDAYNLFRFYREEEPQMPGELLYVFAMSYRIARDWARRNQLEPKQIRYVADVPELLGTDDILVYFHETWWNHPQAWKFRDILRSMTYREYRSKSLEEGFDLC